MVTIKKSLTTLLVSISCVLAMGQTSNAGKTAKPATTPPIKLKNMSDTMQYAIGSYVAQWINSNGFLISEPNIFLRGLDDLFQNKQRLVADSLISPLITAYQQSTQKDRSLRLEQQLFTNIKQRPGLGIFPNGVHYFVIKMAQGQRPLPTDTVVIHFKGNLADGTNFEDTYQKGQPILVTPAEMIPGVSEAILQMPIGARWQLYVPSMLAYGDKSTAVIPPNSALVIEIELLEIRPASK